LLLPQANRSGAPGAPIEAVSQPGQATHGHAHGEVLALNIARADAIGIVIAGDFVALTPDAGSRAVTALAIRIDLAIDLDQHRVVDIFTERAVNSLIG
jgi:hypothetical protein